LILWLDSTQFKWMMVIGLKWKIWSIYSDKLCFYSFRLFVYLIFFTYILFSFFNWKLRCSLLFHNLWSLPKSLQQFSSWWIFVYKWNIVSFFPLLTLRLQWSIHCYGHENNMTFLDLCLSISSYLKCNPCLFFVRLKDFCTSFFIHFL